MPKYLIQANYVGEGLKGLLKEGGSCSTRSRRKAVRVGRRPGRGLLLCLR